MQQNSICEIAAVLKSLKSNVMKLERHLEQTRNNTTTDDVKSTLFHVENVPEVWAAKGRLSRHAVRVWGGGRNRGVNRPSPYFLSQLLPAPYFLFPHPGPSSSILSTPNFSFSPSSLLFPRISPSSQLFLGHFSLLPIMFLPPLWEHTQNQPQSRITK